MSATISSGTPSAMLLLAGVGGAWPRPTDTAMNMTEAPNRSSVDDIQQFEGVVFMACSEILYW